MRPIPAPAGQQLAKTLSAGDGEHLGHAPRRPGVGTGLHRRRSGFGGGDRVDQARDMLRRQRGEQSFTTGFAFDFAIGSTASLSLWVLIAFST